jgi:hypothetical protein
LESKFIEYKNAGFFETKIVEEEELIHLTTPCRFRIDENIVLNLKNNYKSDEEIGGVLWVKPTKEVGEIIHVIDKVSYIRNAIEDNPRNDNRNKSNSYLSDFKQRNEILNDLFIKGYLPLMFHTHPIKGSDFLQTFTNSNLMTETSKQDKLESSLLLTIGSANLLMPRALIVGNETISNDIFIGVYNGFIAPKEFEDSKKKIQEANIKKTAELVSSINFSEEQKISLSIGALLLLYVILKYPKHSMSVIFGLFATLPILLTNTNNITKPNYFNKLSSGSAEIFISN